MNTIPEPTGGTAMETGAIASWEAPRWATHSADEAGTIVHAYSSAVRVTIDSDMEGEPEEDLRVEVLALDTVEVTPGIGAMIDRSPPSIIIGDLRLTLAQAANLQLALDDCLERAQVTE